MKNLVLACLSWTFDQEMDDALLMSATLKDGRRIIKSYPGWIQSNPTFTKFISPSISIYCLHRPGLLLVDPVSIEQAVFCYVSDIHLHSKQSLSVVWSEFQQ